ERVELCAQRTVHPLGSLVPGPELVPERLDDVVGRDADVGRILLEHLEHGVQYPRNPAERRILALAIAARTVEVPEEPVGAVEQVDDHVGMLASSVPRILSSVFAIVRWACASWRSIPRAGTDAASDAPARARTWLPRSWAHPNAMCVR